MAHHGRYMQTQDGVRAGGLLEEVGLNVVFCFRGSADPDKEHQLSTNFAGRVGHKKDDLRRKHKYDMRRRTTEHENT